MTVIYGKPGPQPIRTAKNWRIKSFVLTILGLMIGAASVYGAGLLYRDTLSYDPTDSAVLLSLGNPDPTSPIGYDSNCTAVSMGDGVFWSAAHCAEQVIGARGHIRIYGKFYDALAVNIGDYDPGFDFSVWYVSDPKAPAVPAARIRRTPLKVGEVVIGVGWPTPLGQELVIWGRVANPIVFTPNRSAAPERDDRYVPPRMEMTRGPFIASNLEVAPGNSGGPLYDEDGYLVGINVMKPSYGGTFGGPSTPTTLALSVPMTEICKRGFC